MKHDRARGLVSWKFVRERAAVILIKVLGYNSDIKKTSLVIIGIAVL